MVLLFFFFFCRFCNYCGQREEGNGVLWQNWYDILYNKCIYTKYDDDDSDWKKYVT